MRNVFINFQYIARWFLLIGVLTGIFFSNGEGIQLFPFPVTAETTGKLSGRLPDEFYKPYSLSLHNSAGFSVVLKAKTQKGFKDLAGTDEFRDESHATIFFSSPSRPNSSEAALNHTSIILSSPSDRAPPTIQSQI